MLLLLSEFFGAIKEIAKLIPDFPEKIKKQIDDETKILVTLEREVHDASVTFGAGSSSDELLGMVDDMNAQAEKLKHLYILFAKELKR